MTDELDKVLTVLDDTNLQAILEYARLRLGYQNASIPAPTSAEWAKMSKSKQDHVFGLVRAEVEKHKTGGNIRPN